ncbi:MAG: ketoacyl-ACP synthase III [Desulfovibrio sp.]|nr:ketoacyl-ACP synthase III [Desulfovibrio sp.]
MASHCYIHSPAVSLPDKILSNNDLSAIVDTNDQWIVERTGISERRKLDDNQNASDLGYDAARKCLEAAGEDVASLTHVIAATCTPNYLSPSLACLIAGQLGAVNVMAFDIGAACAGFLYGARVCRAFLAAEPDAKILFVCAEAMSRRVNWKDRSTCVLFGDAGAACLIDSSAADPFCSIVDVICESDGAMKDLIIVGGGTACDYQTGEPVDEGFFISMQGRETYKQAVRQMVAVCEKILLRNNLSIEDINLAVPHQANLRIIEAVGARLGLKREQVFANVANYGNTSAASIPLALYEAGRDGAIRKGDLVLITAFGAGLTWGAALLQF